MFVGVDEGEGGDFYCVVLVFVRGVFGEGVDEFVFVCKCDGVNEEVYCVLLFFDGVEVGIYGGVVGDVGLNYGWIFW